VIGDGTWGQHLSPVHIADDVASFIGSSFDGAFIKADESLWSWGSGLIIGGNIVPRSLSRSPHHIMDDVKLYFCDPRHNFAVKTDGSLWAWGFTLTCEGWGGADDSIWLGNGSEDGSLRQLRIMDDVAFFIPVSDFASTDISNFTPERTMFALKTDGSLWAWGSNKHGLVGDGTGEDQSAPVQIMDNVDSFTLLSGGGYIANDTARGSSIIVIKTDGSLWAWGAQFWDEGTTETLHSPIHISDDAKEVLGMGWFIKNDNSLWRFGVDTPGGSLALTHFLDDIDTASVSLERASHVRKTDGTLWILQRSFSENPEQVIVNMP
jgi:alpha-tubulin suppressor-like RCC1 family protein